MTDTKVGVTLSPETEGSVTLPSGISFGTMDMNRDGADLHIKTSDGQTILVEGFFGSDPPPDLVGVNGERIRGSIAVTLAGPGTSGLAPVELSSESVGQVHTMSGKVFVVRADGTRVEATINMPLFQGDVVETLDDGAIGIVLSDETSFAMSENGVMMLDELIYDPVEQEGNLSLFLLRGLTTVTSGLVSKTDPNGMIIDTPVGTIGIRGTQIGIDATEANTISIYMMEEIDGYVGEVMFTTPAGTIVINQAYQVIGFTSGSAPAFLSTVDAQTITSMFGNTLVHLPTLHGTANDYSTQEPEGGGELDEKPEPEVVPEVEEEAEATPETTVTQVVTEELAEPLEPVAPVVLETTTEPVARMETTPTTIDRSEQTVSEDRDFGVGMNYEPIAFPDTVTTREDQALSGQLVATDADQDALSYALADDGGPANGSVTLNADGSYLYTPDPDFSGTDEFTFSVSDGKGGVTQSTISIQVTPVAAVPSLAVNDISVAGDSGPGANIKGTKGDDELSGTSGDDTISGKGGDDVIVGDTTFIGAIPSIPIDVQVSLEEGESYENLEILLRGVPLDATLSAGTGQGGGIWSLAPDDLEGLTLSLPEDHTGDFSILVEATHTDTNADLNITDTATNSAVINVAVSVAGGDDEIMAGAGDDIVDAGGGDDLIRGGTGDDVLHGGTGNDEIRGDSGEDVIYGGAGDDEIRGGTGDDVIRGGWGDDEIKGGTGDDYIYGGAGDDVIDGGKGDDQILGGAGDDVLHGGKGFDEFIFNLDAGEDVIADYKLGELIRFEGPEFSEAEPQISSNDDGGVSIMFSGHDVAVTVDNVDLSQQSYTITPSDDGVVVVFDDTEG